MERSYYPNGTIRTDVLRLRTYTGVDFGQHVYATDYGYDVLGRVTSVTHPANLAGSGATDRYIYYPAIGALQEARDRFNNAFGFQYDNAGQRTSLTGPGFVDASEYDREGRLTRRYKYAGSAVLHDERFRYDARGKVLDVANGASEYYQWYSGLGMLVATDWENHAGFGFVAEEFGTDALGNVHTRRSGSITTREGLPSYTTAYHPGVGRVATVVKEPAAGGSTDPFRFDRTTRWYDASGNATVGLQETEGEITGGSTGVTRHSRSHSYYSADERLRYYQENVFSLEGSAVIQQGVWEEYRYDPLGRQVMVRSNRADLCDDSGVGQCVSHLTRYVWSGDQLL